MTSSPLWKNRVTKISYLLSSLELLIYFIKILILPNNLRHGAYTSTKKYLGDPQSIVQILYCFISRLLHTIYNAKYKNVKRITEKKDVQEMKLKNLYSIKSWFIKAINNSTSPDELDWFVELRKPSGCPLVLRKSSKAVLFIPLHFWTLQIQAIPYGIARSDWQCLKNHS